MPARPLDQFWIDRIRTEHANAPERTSSELYRLLKNEATTDSRSDYPSERTIRRYREEFAALPADQKRDYQFARWPESCMHGLLPWEAGASLVELTRLLGGRAPTVTHALWFWRVTIAFPSLDPPQRNDAATTLADLDRGGEWGWRVGTHPLTHRDVGEALTTGRELGSRHRGGIAARDATVDRILTQLEDRGGELTADERAVLRAKLDNEIAEGES